jgi:hypothetical protein
MNIETCNCVVCEYERKKQKEWEIQQIKEIISENASIRYNELYKRGSK